MEEKQLYEKDMGDEVDFIEENEFEDDKEKESENRHVFLWVLVILAVVVVLVIWMLVTNKSFKRIDQTLKIDSAQSSGEAINEFKDSLFEFGQLIDDADAEINRIQGQDEVEKEEADELQAVGNKVVDDLEETITKKVEELPAREEEAVPPIE